MRTHRSCGYSPARRRGRAVASLALFVFAAAVGTAHGSPNVSLDDPRYDQLASMYARGILDPFQGGIAPVTEARMDELIGGAGQPPSRWWFRPVMRGLIRLLAARDAERPYSSSSRPRDLVGLIAASCEHVEGRACGRGVGLETELDSSVGYQDWFAVTTRLRDVRGTDAYDGGFSLDRAYLRTTLGPLAAEIGRDVIVLGPSSRTQLGWGDNAPPLDHVRLSTAEPLQLTSSLRASFAYVLGQLRDPQTFAGNLVSIGRGQLDIADDVEVGMMQMLQVLGDGATSLDVFEFLAEHVRRGDLSASTTDSSNRRVGFDVSIRSQSFAGGRFYYAVMFEDWRDRFHHALRHDADHLVGVELAALGPHALVVELHKTGVRSQEHSPRVTGFTNGGRVPGSPLGPDAASLYAGSRLALGRTTVLPSLEFARVSSDTYNFVVDGPISRLTRGTSELRFRAGARVRRRAVRDLWLELETWFEHVERFGFVTGARRENVGLGLAASWRPN